MIQNRVFRERKNPAIGRAIARGNGIFNWRPSFQVIRRGMVFHFESPTGETELIFEQGV